jgi:hypothetical protein
MEHIGDLVPTIHIIVGLSVRDFDNDRNGRITNPSRFL